MQKKTTSHSEDRFSQWSLKELDRWNRLNLVPKHHSQDTEYLCAFFGALDVLSWFGSEVLILVHGSAGCGLSYSGMRPCSGNSGVDRTSVFCTNLNSQHVVYGGRERLTQALRELDEAHRPRLIVVLTNCCSYMIGEDVPGTIQSVANELSADVLSLEVAGCDGTGFRKGADKAFDMLFDYVAKSRTRAQRPSDSRRPSINLFTKRVSGRPAEELDVQEIRRLLAKVDVDVNVVVRAGTSFSELSSLPNAQANASCCFTLGKGPLESLQRLFGQPFAPMIFPLGLESTLTWIEQITQMLGVPNTFPLDPEVEQSRKKIEQLKKAVAGRVAYIWQPGVKGLATTIFAAELGMKPVLFGVSYYLEEQLRPTVEVLLARGLDPDLVLVGKYGLLEETSKLHIDERPLIFMPKKFWLGEGCANVTFNMFSEALLGLRGIDTLVAAVEDALAMVGKKDYRVFNRYIETVYKTTDWGVEKKDTMAGIDSEDLRWKRWNQV